MRLTRIEIENFKGIGDRQMVELRPITLLFGPNSAGKSTILQALHYLREILERGNIDPDVTIAGGLIYVLVGAIPLTIGALGPRARAYAPARTFVVQLSWQLCVALGRGRRDRQPWRGR